MIIIGHTTVMMIQLVPYSNLPPFKLCGHIEPNSPGKKLLRQKAVRKAAAKKEEAEERRKRRERKRKLKEKALDRALERESW